MWSQWRLRGSEKVCSDVGPLSSLSHFLAVLSRQRQVSASNWTQSFRGHSQQVNRNCSTRTSCEVHPAGAHVSDCTCDDYTT